MLDVRRAVELAAHACPELPAPGDAFVAFLAERKPTLPPTLDEARLGELRLAFACGRGDECAIAALERGYGGAIATSLSRVNSTKHSVDDLRQIVKTKLFVGHAPAINQYSGSGGLAAWLGVVTLRTALNAARSRGADTVGLTEASAQGSGLAETADPELDYLRAKYKTDFSAAFARALEELSTRERLLLRQHMVEKLTVRELGRLYDVNSGTVTRWIQRAREGLARRTCEALQDELAVSDDELQSIMRLIRSRVELSITRALT